MIPEQTSDTEKAVLVAELDQMEAKTFDFVRNNLAWCMRLMVNGQPIDSNDKNLIQMMFAYVIAKATEDAQ